MVKISLVLMTHIKLKKIKFFYYVQLAKLIKNKKGEFNILDLNIWDKIIEGHIIDINMEDDIVMINSEQKGIVKIRLLDNKVLTE